MLFREQKDSLKNDGLFLPKSARADIVVFTIIGSLKGT